MKMEVSSAVISDLWPVYSSGDASPDSRALVEAFLAADPALARTLQESSGVTLGVTAPVLPPDHELRTLALTKRRLRGYLWLLQLALLFSCFAFGRIVSDTSWDVSPRNFVITASIAVAFWIAFFVSLIRIRQRQPGGK
jgi:anti-sigma factor RsiW